MPVLITESERSCIWVLRVLTLSTILLLDFEAVSTMWYFFVFFIFHTMLTYLVIVLTVLHPGQNIRKYKQHTITGFICSLGVI